MGTTHVQTFRENGIFFVLISHGMTPKLKWLVWIFWIKVSQFSRLSVTVALLEWLSASVSFFWLELEEVCESTLFNLCVLSCHHSYTALLASHCDRAGTSTIIQISWSSRPSSREVCLSPLMSFNWEKTVLGDQRDKREALPQQECLST